MKRLGRTLGFYGMAAGADAAPLARSAGRALATATLLLIAAAVAIEQTLGLGHAFVLRSLAAFAVAALLLAPLIASHLPHDRIGPANAVTLARAVMVALLAGFIGAGSEPALAAATLAIATPALLLDGVDGWLARRSRMASAFGARFDMETDALLLAILCVLAWQFGKAGAWILAAGLLRYAFVAAAWVLPWMRRPLPASTRRKTVCVVHIVAMLVVVAPFVPPAVAAPLAAAATALLAWSFALDVRWLARTRNTTVVQ